MTDCKDTREGRIVREKYADILPLSRPEPPKEHPRMPAGSRARIFSPFAALRGFEDELSEERGAAENAREPAGPEQDGEDG